MPQVVHDGDVQPQQRGAPARLAAAAGWLPVRGHHAVVGGPVTPAVSCEGPSQVHLPGQAREVDPAAIAMMAISPGAGVVSVRMHGAVYSQPLVIVAEE